MTRAYFIALITALALALAACGGGGGGGMTSMAPSLGQQPAADGPGQPAGGGTGGDTPAPAPETLAGNERFTLDLPGTVPPEPGDLDEVLARSHANAQANKTTSALETEIGRVVIDAIPDGSTIPDIDHEYAFDSDGLGNPIWVEAQRNTASGSTVDEYNMRGSVYNLDLTGMAYAQIGLVTYFCYDYAINLSEDAPNGSYMFNQNLYMLLYYDDGLVSGNPAGYYARVSDMNGLASPEVGPLPTGASGDIAFDFQMRMNPLRDTPVEQWSTPVGGPYTGHDCGDATLYIWPENSSWLIGSELYSTLFQTYGTDNWGWLTADGPELYSHDTLLDPPVPGVRGEDGTSLVGQVYALNNGSIAEMEFDAEFFSGPPWEDDRDWWYATGSNNYNNCTMYLDGPSLPFVEWVYDPAGNLNVSSAPALDELGNIYYGYDLAFAGVEPAGGTALAGYPYNDVAHATNNFSTIGSTVSALFDPVINDGYLYTGLLDASRYIQAIAPDGSFVWEYHMLPNSGDVSTGITEANARVYVAQSAPNNRLRVLDAYTGLDVNVYNFNPDSQNIGFTTPAVADDGTVYMTAGNRVYAFDGGGNPLYAVTLPALCNSSSVSIAPDGVLYVGAADSNLYSLTDTGAALVLNTAFGGGSGFVAGVANNVGMPAVYDTGAGYEIYSSNAVNAVTRLDSSGSVLDVFPTNNPVLSNLAIGDDGICYAADTFGEVYAFDPVSGVNLWPGFSLGTPAIGLAIGPEPADLDNRHSLYVALGDSRLVCINDDGGSLLIDCTSLEGCLFDIYSVTDGAYVATNIDTDVVYDASGVLEIGDEFYLEFKVDHDVPHPTDRALFPANPADGDNINILTSGFSPQGNQALYFTPQITINGFELVLNDYAYTRVVNDMESLSHAYYQVWAREAGTAGWTQLPDPPAAPVIPDTPPPPYETTGSYSDQGSLALHTFVLRHDVEFVTDFANKPYPEAGSDGSSSAGQAELVYPSDYHTAPDGYLLLQGMSPPLAVAGPVLTELDQTAGANNDYTDYVDQDTTSLAGGLAGVDGNAIAINRLQPDAYCRFEAEPGATLVANFGLFDVGAGSWITAPAQWRDVNARPWDTFAFARGTTFNVHDGAFNTTNVTVDPGAAVGDPARLNGATAYSGGMPPHDPGWHSVTLALGGADIHLDVLPVRIWDDPDAADPGDPGTITTTASGWDVELNFVLQYGANPALTPYTVEADTDYDGTWGSGGNVYALTGNPYDAPGLYTDTVSILYTAQPTGSYTFALKMTDSAGDEYVFPYSAANGYAQVTLVETFDSYFYHQGNLGGGSPATTLWGVRLDGSGNANVTELVTMSGMSAKIATTQDGSRVYGIDFNTGNINYVDVPGGYVWAPGADVTTTLPAGNTGGAFIPAGAHPAYPGDTLFVVNNSTDSIYTVDVSTGVTTNLGTIAIENSTDIVNIHGGDCAFDSDGNLYLATNMQSIGSGVFGSGLYKVWRLDSGDLRASHLLDGGVIGSVTGVSVLDNGQGDILLSSGGGGSNIKVVDEQSLAVTDYTLNRSGTTPSLGSADMAVFKLDGPTELEPVGHWQNYIGNPDYPYMRYSPYSGPATAPAGNWSYGPADGVVYGGPTIMDGSLTGLGVNDGDIYFSTSGGSVYRLAGNGAYLDHTSATLNPLASSPTVDARGFMYVGGSYASSVPTVYSLSAVDCEVISTFVPYGNGQITSTPTVGPDGTVYICITQGSSGSRATYLFALNVDGSGNLSEKWRYNLGFANARSDSNVAIGENGTLYVGSPNGSFYALWDRGTTAVLKWSISLDAAPIAASPCLSPDGRIYIGTYGGNNDIYALRDAGIAAAVDWTFDTSANGITGGIFTTAAVNETGSELYFGTLNSGGSHLAAVSSGGALLWNRNFSANFLASPVVDASGTVFAASYAQFMALDANNLGTTLWSVNHGSSSWFSPGITPTGQILFGTHSGFMYSY